MTTSPTPVRIDHDTPPPGIELRLLSFAGKRPKIKSRLVLFHTNGAARGGSILSSIRHAERAPGVNTAPHFQVDFDAAAMLLPLDVKGIGNYQAAPFSWVVETADTGYLDDPTVSAFTDYQVETCAVIAAYAHLLDGVPLSTPTAWDGTGIASHTDPFGYPHWTNAKGKICPGDKKKAQVRNVILPRAREIAAAWTATPAPIPLPPEDDDMAVRRRYVARKSDGRFYQGFDGLGEPQSITRKTIGVFLAGNECYDAKTGVLLWGTKSGDSISLFDDANPDDVALWKALFLGVGAGPK